jgi:phenylacetate-CoA ligase
VYYNPVETISRDELAALQTERLRATMATAAAAPFYAQRFSEAGVWPDDITSPEDITRLPFTTKDDLRANYPTGLVTCDKRELVRLHASSGTTGTPTAILYTREDLDAWSELMARCLYMAGVRPEDVFQNIAGYGLFTGGLGIHYGAERLGCLTVPAGAGNTARQLKLIKDFAVSVAHIIPSYALYLGSVLERKGINPVSLPLRTVLIGAEPHTEQARRRIEEMLDVRAFNSFGLSEMNGPGVAFECTEQNGMHIWEDAYLVEILDPVTDEPVPEGEVGELVMTTLTRKGMPLFRYRTRDLTRFIPGECPCGRTHRRIDRIAGRADDMMILKGVNIYPMQIEQVVMAHPEVGQNYVIALTREGVMDQLVIRVEVKDEYFVEDMRALRSLQDRLVRDLRTEILITPRVELVQHNTLPQSEGKAVRVIDERENTD